MRLQRALLAVGGRLDVIPQYSELRNPDNIVMKLYHISLLLQIPIYLPLLGLSCFGCSGSPG